MRFFKLFIILLFLSSCESKEQIQSEIMDLSSRRLDIYREIDSLQLDISNQKQNLSSLKKDVLELEIYSSGRTPKYVVKIRCKQSRISLDLEKLMKDEMNKFEFELPVDKDFYKSVSVGDDIADNFRVGSFIMNGTFSNWNLTVIDKRII